MLIISDRQLLVDGVMHAAGIPFDCEPRAAIRLLQDGVARKAEPPKVLYETKVVAPPEVGPTMPFRHVPVSDQEPETMAAEGDAMLSGADLREQGAIDNFKRRGRPRFGAKR